MLPEYSGRQQYDSFLNINQILPTGGDNNESNV